MPVWYSVAASTRYARRSQFSENRRCERNWLLMGTDRPDLHVQAPPSSHNHLVLPVIWVLFGTSGAPRERGFRFLLDFQT